VEDPRKAWCDEQERLMRQDARDDAAFVRSLRREAVLFVAGVILVVVAVATFTTRVKGAEPRFEVVNRCPPAFVVVNRLPAPAPADRFTATDGTVYERGADGHYRAVPGAPAVAPPTFRQPGGCGCTTAANCGASFCKSHGGTGCPASCPVKQR
jgi:hypothetical protein